MDYCAQIQAPGVMFCSGLLPEMMMMEYGDYGQPPWAVQEMMDYGYPQAVQEMMGLWIPSEAVATQSWWPPPDPGGARRNELK
ncbi:hypothetical protein DUI87_08630 [Hirundo rustica rustica]|uniref:Uncharacterized protein n=1 Tax=Hirundo rustica rustica TaxID=333673 RepID=A0A3M0KQE9_HIRRU|nr:hypothetical protein DUI87_08630 [Hirundo rustica rustica]